MLKLSTKAMPSSCGPEENQVNTLETYPKIQKQEALPETKSRKNGMSDYYDSKAVPFITRSVEDILLCQGTATLFFIAYMGL